MATGAQAVSPNKKVQLVSVGSRNLPDDRRSPRRSARSGRGQARTGGHQPANARSPATPRSSADNQDAFDNALVIVGIVTIVLIIVLLLSIYRSPWAALLPVVPFGVVTVVSTGLIAPVAEAFDLQVDQSLTIILTVVLFGVGTDYIVFLLFRFRERLRAGRRAEGGLDHGGGAGRRGHRVGGRCDRDRVHGAAARRVRRVPQPRARRWPSPSVVMALAAVTLVPAVVSLFGTKVFWPSKSWQRAAKGTAFQGVGRFTARRPGVVAIASRRR